MRKLLVLILCIACAWFAYDLFFSKPTPVANPDPFEQLEVFMKNQAKEILGPLPLAEIGKISSPTYIHQLRALREDIRKTQVAASSSSKRQHASAGVKLCDALISASNERDKHIVRINNIRANTTASPLAKNPYLDRKEKLAFFESGVALSWHEASRKLHKAVDGCYTQMRKTENPN